jgi:hypothetical protein
VGVGQKRRYSWLGAGEAQHYQHIRFDCGQVARGLFFIDEMTDGSLHQMDVDEDMYWLMQRGSR